MNISGMILLFSFWICGSVLAEGGSASRIFNYLFRPHFPNLHLCEFLLIRNNKCRLDCAIRNAIWNHSAWFALHSRTVISSRQPYRPSEPSRQRRGNQQTRQDIKGETYNV